MSKKPWRILTVNLTEQQYRQLKAVAGLKGISASAFVKSLLDERLKTEGALLKLLALPDHGDL